MQMMQVKDHQRAVQLGTGCLMTGRKIVMTSMNKFIPIDLKDGVPADMQFSVVAIGNFDGIHRGHQAVLELAKDIARSENRPALMMTFEPHPRSLFKPDMPVFRLTPQSLKAQIIEKLGLDGMVVVPFDLELAGTSADDFVAKILLEKLNAGHVVTGYNFHFGKGRLGTPAFLQEAGRKNGFGVTTVPSFEDESGEPVSSSRIRAALESGNVVQASGLLGYRWNAEGIVQKGKQLGRTLGFPTANLELPSSNRLANGIYAARLRRQDGTIHDGVACYGRRPTFDNGVELLETFVFDFDDNLYGEKISVSLFGYLRGEEKFDSVDALVEQMKKDAVEARALLAGVRPLSELDEALNFPIF